MIYICNLNNNSQNHLLLVPLIFFSLSSFTSIYRIHIKVSHLILSLILKIWKKNEKIEKNSSLSLRLAF